MHSSGERGRIEDSFTLHAMGNQPTYRLSKLRMFCVALFGGLLGMALCFAVNAILFELSLSRVFAFYFGLLFCVLGALMLLRSFYQPTWGKKLAVFLFAVLVILSGVCSLVFKTEWLWTLGVGTKILIYSMLGVSTSFTITFAYLDILSFCHDSAMDSLVDGGGEVKKKLGLFESSNQVWLILVLSICTGLTYGITFGTQEEHGLEQAQLENHGLRVDFFVKSLGQSLLFTLPFGFLLGMGGALCNEFLRHGEIVYGLKREFNYQPVSTLDEINGI
ncbi:hypothetical protein BASA81_006547 [Batrachochytrium salamandrivorans]|nr:hypothetical protein BASA81_006547 [Batrachochytrium salamandrivorans]